MTETLAAAVATDLATNRDVPPDTAVAIEVRDLTMSYGGRQVLRGVDFEVRAGEVFCLLGPNGAGKTTTVEILEGFRQRSGGTVRVLGMDPAAQPARLRERIGIVLQECGFPRQARVAELIDIWRAYYRTPRPLEELLAVVELTEDRNAQVRRLSGGQRRRLDLALALAGDPELIFLDEPTTGFDPESRRRCWAAIENLRALGKTIVLTTHYLDEAERLADRVAILQAGRIQVDGTVRHVARKAGVATRISFTAPQQLRDGSLAPPSCLDVALNGDVAACLTDNTSVALRELLAWAAANDLGDLDDLSVEAPTLEDAYLQLVSGGAQ
jgi:ABC-2 type transport system ATP-binding protein